MCYKIQLIIREIEVIILQEDVTKTELRSWSIRDTNWKTQNDKLYQRLAHTFPLLSLVHELA